MLLLGVKNVSTQEVGTNGLINLGQTYRRYCKKNSCGVRTFDFSSNSISLNQQGIYHITATLVGSGDEAGVITIQLLENGEVVDGAVSSETITTIDTELRTFVIDYYILTDADCILGSYSTIAKSISFVNTGVSATFTSVVVNVEKVV